MIFVCVCMCMCVCVCVCVCLKKCALNSLGYKSNVLDKTKEKSNVHLIFKETHI